MEVIEQLNANKVIDKNKTRLQCSQSISRINVNY